MRPDFSPTVSAAMATMVRTDDGRAIRHAARRLDDELAGLGWSPTLRQAYLEACQHVADVVAQRDRGRPARRNRRPA